MKEILDQIEHELTAGINRRPATPRARQQAGRPGALLAAAAAATSVTGVALAAAGVGVPGRELLFPGTPFQEQAGAPRIVNEVRDYGGLRWTVTTFLTDGGLLSSTARPQGARRASPAVGGAAGFVVAANLRQSPFAGLGLSLARGSRTHVLISGTADAKVRAVSVSLAGKRREANLSRSTISLAVKTPSTGLTAEGRRLAERLPSTVTVRQWAATLAPDGLQGRTVVRLRLTATLADGTRRSMLSGPLCVSRRCGNVPQVIDR